MTIFGIGPFELLIIALIALVVVGPERLPEMMFQIGQGVNKAKKMIVDLRNQARAEMGDDFDSLEEVSRQIRELDPRRHIQELGRSLLDDPTPIRTQTIDPPATPKILPSAKRAELIQLAQVNLDEALLDTPLADLPNISSEASTIMPPSISEPMDHAKEVV